MSEAEEGFRVQMLPSEPPRSVVTAAQFLAATAARDIGLNNGPTALYWNLMSVIYQHATNQEAKK